MFVFTDMSTNNNTLDYIKSSVERIFVIINYFCLKVFEEKGCGERKSFFKKFPFPTKAINLFI